MLTERREAILKLLIQEYIATASPVGSGKLARGSGMRVSAATVRNEMADLETDGYITRPHTSAGGIPADKGYRHYVETLEGLAEPSAQVREAVRQKMTEAKDVELWAKLAATVLSQLVRNMAVVTYPRAGEVRVRNIQLVSVHDDLALVVLVLQETQVHQQMLSLTDPATADDLVEVGNRLNAHLGGKDRLEIAAMQAELSPLEGKVAEVVIGVLEAEEQERMGEQFVDGLSHILSKPELAEGERAVGLVEALEGRRLLKSLIASLTDGPVTVVIGGENEDEALRPFSVVISPYGVPGEFRGAVAAIGPTRMEYAGTMGTAQYMSSLLTDLFAEVFRR
ncbi:MAG: heat-inducible transcriptional repressor [Chloroflexi bacterium]|jgi:heat-inducible transcriptional repressor|nr:MAG: heat-inducible transcriptional repressor [Chloroflexota bacterium]